MFRLFGYLLFVVLSVCFFLGTGLFLTFYVMQEILPDIWDAKKHELVWWALPQGVSACVWIVGNVMACITVNVWAVKFFVVEDIRRT